MPPTWRHSAMLMRMVLVSAAFAAAATAEPLPDFWLRKNLEEADHIVLVSEGDRIDGNVVVVQSLRGKLAEGTEIRIPDLAKFAEEDFPIAAPRDEVLTGRMILFLKGQWSVLTPATNSSYACSTIWIGKGRVFTWYQNKMPGPCAVRPALRLKGKDERATIDFIREFDRVTPLLRQALSTKSPVERAKKLEPLLGSGFVHRQAFEGIQKCGADAIDVLWSILENADRWRWHPASVDSLAKLTGKDCAPRLVRILKQDLPYWRRVAPELKYRGWSASQPARKFSYWKLQHILEVLTGFKDPSARAEVEELRDLCKKHPLLGHDQGNADLMPAVERYLQIFDPK